MTTTREATKLREEIDAHQATGKRYPATLKERVVAYAEQQRRAGHTYGVVSTELGMCSKTLRQWCVGRSPNTQTMKPVKIVDAPSAKSTVAASRPSPLSVVLPGGVRVEGVTLDDVVMLVRVLG